MMAENHWWAVRVTPSATGYTKLLSRVVDGVRVWREQHWVVSFEEEKQLVQERYYTSNPERAHSTPEAALAAALEPIENNAP
jgi:hypothetical protein